MKIFKDYDFELDYYPKRTI